MYFELLESNYFLLRFKRTDKLTHKVCVYTQYRLDICLYNPPPLIFTFACLIKVWLCHGSQLSQELIAGVRQREKN